MGTGARTAASDSVGGLSLEIFDPIDANGFTGAAWDNGVFGPHVTPGITHCESGKF